MNPEDRQPESHETPKTGIRIEYSPEYEAKVINETLDELQWLKDEGYGYRLPAAIEAKIKAGETPSPEDVQAALAEEYDAEKYAEASAAIAAEWQTRKEEIRSKLATLGSPMPDAYVLRLTKYGVGGSYHLPNTVDMNIRDVSAPEALATAVHEMIHLAIEEDIEKYQVDHWTKERLVDLTFNRFFPKHQGLQRDPENAERVQAAFDQYYPDIGKVIQAITSGK